MDHATIDHAAGGGPPPEPAETERRVTVVGRFARHLPTLIVMGLLAGLGAYGHHSGWKLPKFSELAGTGAPGRDDWCEDHAVPKSQCVECKPDLLPRGKDFGWCEEHGVHVCPLCHPEVAQLEPAPMATDRDRERAARALALAPRLENNRACKNYRRRVQFASHAAAVKAGVEIAPWVKRQPMSESVAASGQIAYDQTRFASLSSRLPGTVWRVDRHTGDQVRAGEVLALVDAAEVGRAKTELIQASAHEQLQRHALKRLGLVADIVSGGKLQEAQAEMVHARARLLSAQQALVNLGLSVNLENFQALPADQQVRHLRLLGIPEPLARQFNPAETTANLLPVKAPLDGTIVARQAVAGEVVDSSRVLFQVADTGRMWLTLNVSAEDAGKLALGQPVRFRPDGSRDEVRGSLRWISTTADPQTRAVTVRAELPNPQGQLRNETFGTGRIILREEPDAVTVPNEAVHWDGCCHVVFIRDKAYFQSDAGPKVFHVRTVRLGAKGETSTEIIAGVLPGEVVATKGSDVLRAELLKNNLGEGCCE